MNLIFIGLQGSGKGTQAKIISNKLGYCHLSTGDLLRSATGSIAEKVSNIMRAGELVPDEIIFELLREKLKNDECKNGIILDGVPRNLNQAKILDSIVNIDKVVEIKIPDDEALRRLVGRVICKKCGASYNLYTSPKPKNDKVCDICGGELYHRPDDNPDAIMRRISLYHEETEPILKYYGNKVISVNGVGDLDTITNEIISKLGL